MTGRVAECPVDEMNRPRGAGRAALRIPPSAVQVGVLFAGWRAELGVCRKFAPACGCRKPASPGQIALKVTVGSVPRSGAGRAGFGPSGGAMIFGLWA